VKIKGIRRIPFEGTVYNLGVADDESYVANGMIVHNCTLIPITSIEIEDMKAKGEGVKVATEADFPPDFPDPGFKSFSENETNTVLNYQKEKKERLNIIIKDRYNGNLPNPETMCKGQCEGRGWVPIKKDDMQEPFRTLWLEAEKEKPSEDGWHFVKCPNCNGTGEEIKDFIRFDLNSSSEWGHYRLVNPASFKKDLITTWDTWAGIENAGIKFRVGNLKSNDEKAVQSILFERNKWTENRAIEWWNAHRGKFEKTWTQADWDKTKYTITYNGLTSDPSSYAEAVGYQKAVKMMGHEAEIAEI